MATVMESAFDPRFGEVWSKMQLIGALAIPGTWALIAREGAAVVGFALVRVILDEAELLLVAVTPSAQRHGCGTRLLTQAMDMARLRGARTMFLEVRAGNEAAIHLYDVAGFKQVGQRKNYYHGAMGEWFDAITMRHDL